MKPIICKTTGEVAATYPEYLKTNHWEQLKMQLLKSRSNPVCFCCHAALTNVSFNCGIHQVKYLDFHIHHKTYKRIGREKLSDLAFVCPSCHKQVHDTYKAMRFPHLWNAGKKFRAKLARVAGQLRGGAQKRKGWTPDSDTSNVGRTV